MIKPGACSCGSAEKGLPRQMIDHRRMAWVLIWSLPAVPLTLFDNLATLAGLPPMPSWATVTITHTAL